MKRAKQLLFQLPEFYIIAIILLSGFTPPFSFHWLAVSGAAILILQIIFKTKISGLILAGLFILVNLVLLGALISEYNEFVTYTDDAYQLLIVGLLLWILNVFFASIMVFKYSNLNKPNLLQTIE